MSEPLHIRAKWQLNEAVAYCNVLIEEQRTRIAKVQGQLQAVEAQREPDPNQVACTRATVAMVTAHARAQIADYERQRTALMAELRRRLDIAMAGPMTAGDGEAYRRRRIEAQARRRARGDAKVWEDGE